MRSPAKTLYVLLLSLILFAGCLNAPGAADDDDDDDDDSDSRLVPFYGNMDGFSDDYYERHLFHLNTTGDEVHQLLSTHVCFTGTNHQHNETSEVCVTDQLRVQSHCENGNFTSFLSTNDYLVGSGMTCSHEINIHSYPMFSSPYQEWDNGRFSMLFEVHELD